MPQQLNLATFGYSTTSQLLTLWITLLPFLFHIDFHLVLALFMTMAKIPALQK